MSFLQVILRNIFASGIIWGDIFLRHLVLWVGLLGASLATRGDRHISIDVLSRFLGPAGKRRVHRITHIFSTLVCGLLVRASYVFIRDEWAAGTTLILGIPVWLFMSVILIGFVVMTFRFSIKIFIPSIADQVVSQEE